MGVEDVHPFVAQVAYEPGQTQRVLRTCPRLTAHATDPLALHEFSEPGRHRFEGTEEHPVALSVVPLRELREKAARII